MEQGPRKPHGVWVRGKILEAAPSPGAHSWQTGGPAEESDQRMPSSPGHGALPSLGPASPGAHSC